MHINRKRASEELEYASLFLSPEAKSITKYHTEWISEGLGSEFTLKFCEKGNWWYSGWKKHRRIVISIAEYDGGKCLTWGYNHDFIPQYSDGKLTYHRTDKSFTFDLCSDWTGCADYDPDSDRGTALARMRYDIPDRSTNTAKARQYIVDVTKRSAALMKEWFDRVQSVEDEIAEIDMILDALDSDLTELRYIKAFLIASLGDAEKAEAEMKRYYGMFPPPEAVMQKLRQTAGL